MGRVGRKTQNNDAVTISKVAEAECAMAIVAVEDEEAVLARILETCRSLGRKILLKPEHPKLLVCPPVG